jgi:hypothetical protein
MLIYGKREFFRPLNDRNSPHHDKTTSYTWT